MTETQTNLSSLSSELGKNRDQVHEDRRSVGFTFLVGQGWGRGVQLERSRSFFRHQPTFSLFLAMALGQGIVMGNLGMHETLS